MSENVNEEVKIEKLDINIKKLDTNDLIDNKNIAETTKNCSRSQQSTLAKLDSLTREDLIVYIKNLYNLLSNLRKNLEECKKQLNKKDEEIETLSKQNLKNFEQQNATNSEQQNVTDTFLAQKANILTMELQDYKKNLELTRQELKISNDQLNEKELVTKEILKKLSEVEEKKENALNDLQQTNNQLKELRQVLEEKSVTIAENSKEIKMLVTQIFELKNNLEKEIKELNQIILTKSEEINKLNLQNESTLESLKKTKADLQYSNQHCKEISEEFLQFKERAEYVLKQQENSQILLENKTTNNETKFLEIQQLLETIDLKNQKINELMEKNALLEENLQLLNQQMESAKIELELCNEKNTKLCIKYENDQKNLIVDHKKQILTYKKQIDELTINKNLIIESFQKKITDLEEEKKNEINDLIKKNKNLEEEFNIYKNQTKNNLDQHINLNNDCNTENNNQSYKKKTSNENLIKTNTNKNTFNCDNLNYVSIISNASEKQEENDESEEDDLISSLQSVVNYAVENSQKKYDDIDDLIWKNKQSYNNVDNIILKLDESNAQIMHLKELLVDAEETNVKLEEQVQILKEEIRRIERNNERSNHISCNSEYLKNIILNFLAPQKVQDERYQIIPILQTMLKLNSEECALLEKAINEKTIQNENKKEKKDWSNVLSPLWGMF